MFKLLTIILMGAIFSLHAVAADYDKAQLLENVNNAINKCRTLINEIDKKPASLWSPKLGVFEFSKKSKLKELQKAISFNAYLDYINDLKVKAGKQKVELDNLINNWAKDLHTLNMKVSEDLRAYSSFCSGPVKAIKEHLTALENLAK